jgi:hypothetical protein
MDDTLILGIIGLGISSFLLGAWIGIRLAMRVVVSRLPEPLVKQIVYILEKKK